MVLKVIKSSNKRTLRDKYKLQHIHSRIITTTPPPVPAVLWQAPVTEAHNAVQNTIAVLQTAGLQHYFIICKRSEEESKRIVQRCAQFIVWSHTSYHKTTIHADTDTVSAWFKELVQNQYSQLMFYCEYLVNMKHLQPSTVRTYATDLERCFAWCTLFAPPLLKLPMNAHEGIRAVAEMVRTNQARSHRAARSHNTWHEQVKNRRVPAGGLAALQAAVHEELPWARSVRQQNIDDTAYRRFMQIMISAVYVFSANGRQSGVADVRMRQVEELLEEGYTTTTKFKTNKKYGYQPITLGSVARELVQQYVSFIRPQVCRAQVVNADDHLWLTYRGAFDTTIGKLVTFFFIRMRGLTVTTTAIRGLVETTMHQKWKAGEISEIEKTAVQNINGHTSETTRDYYLLEDRREDVVNARAAFAPDDSDLGIANEMLWELVDDEPDTPVASPVPTPAAAPMTPCLQLLPRPPQPRLTLR